MKNKNALNRYLPHIPGRAWERLHTSATSIWFRLAERDGYHELAFASSDVFEALCGDDHDAKHTYGTSVESRRAFRVLREAG